MTYGSGEANDISFTCQKNYLPWARLACQNFNSVLFKKCSYPISPKILAQREKMVSCRAHCSGMLVRGISPTYKVPWTLHWEHETCIASAFLEASIASVSHCVWASKRHRVLLWSVFLRKAKYLHIRRAPNNQLCLKQICWVCISTTDFIVFYPTCVIYSYCVYLYILIPCYYHHLFSIKK